MKLNPSYNFFPFVSDESKEQAVYELLERTEFFREFCGVNFGPQILNPPINHHFKSYAADLFSDFAEASKLEYPVFAGLPEDQAYILLRADKSTAATLYQIEKLRLNNPAAEIWIIGENANGIKGQQKKIEREIGPTQTYTIGASCRIFQVFAENTPNAERFLSSIENEILKEERFKNVLTLPGVFSLKKLDKGSSLLIDSTRHIIFENQKVLDYGCGCGLLSLYALESRAAQVHAADLSKMAVENTRLQNLSPLEKEALTTHWTCLESEIIERDFDIIITNPPFHLKQSLRTDFPKLWIESCEKMLGSQGTLLLVCNKFLDYEKLMTSTFKKTKVIGESKEFIVIQSTK